MVTKKKNFLIFAFFQNDLIISELLKISDRIILIKYTQLVSKCIIKDLGNGNYLISEFLVDNDYN
jgi:hypothetical protein